MIIKKNEQGFIQIILVLVLVVFTVGGAYYFGTLKNKPNSSVVVPTPTASQAPTDDLANWKTYTNASSNYEIRYPEDWKITNQSAGSFGVISSDARYIEIGLGEGKSGTVGFEEIQVIPPSEETNLNSTKVVNGITLRCNGKFTTDMKTWCWIKVPNQDKYLNVQVFKNSSNNMNEILDQILSTFKFTK